MIAYCGEAMRPDGVRTVLRPFHVADPSREGAADGRTAGIIDRILSLSPRQAEEELWQASDALSERHHDAECVLRRRFDDLASALRALKDVGGAQARLHYGIADNYTAFSTMDVDDFVASIA